MSVQSFRPQIRLTLKKNLTRTAVAGGVPASARFTGSKRVFDLTPYLGQGDQVSFTRTVRGGAGTFSLTFIDKPDTDQAESLYGLFEPMDVIEIAMARSPTSATLPVVFRGFVSDIGRNLAMTDTGPRRTVTITGEDYGKILEIIRVYYYANLVIGSDLLSALKLFINYGVGADTYKTPVAFFQDIHDKVIAPFLTTLRGGSASSPVQDLQLDATATGGSIAPFGVNEWEGGTILDLLRTFGDVGPWNELFVEDRDDGPWLVYRPVPFRRADGTAVQADASRTVTVSDEALISFNVGRSDRDVANFYWVEAPRLTLLDGTALQADALNQPNPAPFLKDYPNASPDFYGVRPMIVTSNQGLRVDGQALDTVAKGKATDLALLDERRRVLIESNKDAIVFEQGGLQLRGDETIRHGCYLRLNRGGKFSSDHYAHTVTQTFTWGVSFQTDVQFDRGTGFIARAQRGDGPSSPYYAEVSAGGVYRDA